MEDSYDLFEKIMGEGLQTGGPFYESELKDIYTNAKSEALAKFSHSAVGEEKGEYLQGLRSKMKNKYD